MAWVGFPRKATKIRRRGLSNVNRSTHCAERKAQLFNTSSRVSHVWEIARREKVAKTQGDLAAFLASDAMLGRRGRIFRKETRPPAVFFLSFAPSTTFVMKQQCYAKSIYLLYPGHAQSVSSNTWEAASRRRSHVVRDNSTFSVAHCAVKSCRVTITQGVMTCDEIQSQG